MKTGRLILGSAKNCSDIFYATLFNAPDPFLYFSFGREKGIFVSALEYTRAKKECKKGITVYEQVGGILKGIDAILEKYPADLWEVPAEFPFLAGEHMLKKGRKLKAMEGMFFHSRLQKTKDEILNIRDALKISEKGMAAAVAFLKDACVDKQKRIICGDGLVSSEMLRSVIEGEIIKAGGYIFDTIVAGGRQGADPHCTGSGCLYAGKPIVIDIYPRHKTNNYWGDITRTFVKGRAPSIVSKAYDAVRNARDSSKKLICDGVIPAQVYNLALRTLERHDFKTGKKNDVYFGFFHSLGHGLGLDLHEEPRVSAKNHLPLMEGNVITVEPGLYYPTWGGVRLEDVVVVEKKSCRTLTTFPDFMEIK